MSHSQNNLSRTPRVKRQRLTFTVTVDQPKGMTRAQLQWHLGSRIDSLLIEHGGIAPDSGPFAIVKLHRSETIYGGEDE